MADLVQLRLEGATQARIHPSLEDDAGGTVPRGSQGRAETTSRISNSCRVSKDVTESRDGSFAEETLGKSPRRPIKRNQCFCSFPMFNVSPHEERNMALLNDPLTDSHRETSNCEVDLNHVLLQSSEGDKAPLMLSKANPKLKVTPSECTRPNNSDMTPSANCIPLNSRINFFPLPRKPCKLKNMEATRICTTVDSVQAFYSDSCDITRATRFLLREGSALNLFEGSQTFRESRFSLKLKDKLFSSCPLLSCNLGFGVQGMKSQHAEMDETERTEGVKRSALCINNESSAETRVMDIGQSSTSSAKTLQGFGNSSESQATAALHLEDNGNRVPNNIVFDQKNGFPVRDVESSFGTSKTLSMNVERLLPNPKKHKGVATEGYCSDLSELEPSSRWVKRLRRCASDSIGCGTKSLEIGEPSKREKVNVFNQTLDSWMTSSEIKGTNSGCKKTEATGTLVKNEKLSSSEKLADTSLSHPWILRWLRKSASSTTNAKESLVDIELGIPEVAAVDEIPKKQFPSIGAMALMGRAFNGLSPSDLERKGSIIVWNKRNFR